MNLANFALKYDLVFVVLQKILLFGIRLVIFRV